MPPRCLAVLVAGAALLETVAVAQAQLDERQLMLTGGAPKSRAFNFFGFTGSDLSRTAVNFPGEYRPGTIVIDTAERRLYLVQDGGTALRYGIGVGRVGFTWKGVRRVTDKKEWPGWTPPAQMLKRQP
ncbi:MAG: L,D-transpeptidase, partial [Xanthobacteraceae bacterium]